MSAFILAGRRKDGRKREEGGHSGLLDGAREEGIAQSDGIAECARVTILAKVAVSGLILVVFWPGCQVALNRARDHPREEGPALRRAVDLRLDSWLSGPPRVTRAQNTLKSSSGKPGRCPRPASRSGILFHQEDRALQRTEPLTARLHCALYRQLGVHGRSMYGRVHQGSVHQGSTGQGYTRTGTTLRVHHPPPPCTLAIRPATSRKVTKTPNKTPREGDSGSQARFLPKNRPASAPE